MKYIALLLSLSLCLVGCGVNEAPQPSTQSRAISIRRSSNNVSEIPKSQVFLKQEPALSRLQNYQDLADTIPAITIQDFHLKRPYSSSWHSPIKKQEWGVQLGSGKISRPQFNIVPNNIPNPDIKLEPTLSTPNWTAPNLQPQLSLELDFDALKSELKFDPAGAKLRPRSPYTMPGHLSFNNVVCSVHDGLPLHPGVW